ncbi:MAG: hypothetical protein H6733_01190 [Alphaproteobacteria bacterium]|nr:hypothetical protein [Alphaproteobacteria bacterium]
MQDTRARRSWLVVAALGAAAIVQPLACTPGVTVDPELDAAFGAALADLAPHVIVPALDAAQTATATLATACTAWAEAPGDATARAAAQTAWRSAMAAWQPIEVMQVGPLGSALDAVGGEGLRDRVYSWPTTNPCRVDETTVDGSYSDADFFDTALVHVTGLDALEVLLFGDDTVQACGSEDALAASWSALGAEGVAAARAAYATVLADDVAARVTLARTRWSPDGDDFGALMVSPGVDGSPFGSRHEAIDDVFDALFYLESTTVDDKLARPLGVADCDTATCPEAVESPLAGGSLDWIRANLDGVEAVFTGGDGDGLDDVVRSLGQEAMVTDVMDAIAAARAAADAIDGDLAAAVDDDAADVTALYDAVHHVTDVLGDDLVPLLSLTLPSEAGGDND